MSSDMDSVQGGTDGYYGAAELSERFDELLDIDLPRDVIQVENRRALDVLLVLLQNYDPSYDEDLPEDPLQAAAIQRLLQRAVSRGAWEAIYSAHGARLDAYTGLSNNYADMSSSEIRDELRSLWTDYDTFQAVLWGPLPPRGPTGVGKTNFAYKLLEVGKSAHEDLSIASNNETDNFETIQSWSELKEWLKTEDGRKAFLLDEGAQVLQYADQTAGKVLSQMLKLLRKYNGNLLVVGHTGKDIPKDLRRQLLAIRKESDKKATVGVGMEEQGDGEMVVRKTLLRLEGIEPTVYEYDDLDTGDFEFDMESEDQEECKVVIQADDDREDKQAGGRCGNVENVSSGVCSECRSEYDDSYVSNYESS